MPHFTGPKRQKIPSGSLNNNLFSGGMVFIEIRKIEKLKKDLGELLKEKGFRDEEVLEISRELDKLIVEYMKKDDSDEERK